MRIKNVKITNYRNIKCVDVPLSKITTVIGNNNSGKSNFLRAVTLPLLSENISSGGKSLTWTDLNNEAKDRYFEYILKNKSNIIDDELDKKEFEEIVPFVKVRLDLEVPGELHELAKEFLTEEGGKFIYALEYKYECKNFKKLLEHVKNVINHHRGDSLLELKQNLLPIHLYTYTIYVPFKNHKISFDTLKYFRYNSIKAERDDFSNNNKRVGSRALVETLNNKLEIEDKIMIEEEYNKFFGQIRTLSNMDNILNWQDVSEVENVKDFFEKISVLPNMPPLTSLLNSVQLGFDEEGLYAQGLGYRNLVLQLVLINSLMDSSELVYSLLTIEEPEAHLCYRNEKLFNSFLNQLNKDEMDIQVISSTHSVEFINKINLNNLLVFDEGKAFAFTREFSSEELNYLSRNPNMDIFKMLYSKNCILVEGITEEFLIKSYLNNQDKYLNDVHVLSFHKGFTKIIELWLKLNENSNNKLGIIRDYDNQENAKLHHHSYNDHPNIMVKTTVNYTLEDDFVEESNNYPILKEYFSTKYNWTDIDTASNLSEKWKTSKADTMLKLCQDMSIGLLKGVVLPNHIQSVLEFMMGV